ncbi:MAG TPA: hypothetical protein VGP82_03625 [Ktedonobacterales bacterium]|nr:hypothetical protein [Ktedonobacterales bacterium]
MVTATLKWGAVVGLVTYLVVDLALTAIGLVAFGPGPADLNTDPGKLALGCASIFLLLFAFSAAGYFAGRATGNAGAGALAGMVAATIYALLIQVYTPGGGGVAAPATAGGAPMNAMATIVVLVITAALFLGVAALMGWLGGRPGAQRSPRHVHVSNPVPEAGEAPR